MCFAGWLYPFGIDEIRYQDYRPCEGWIVEFKSGDVIGLFHQNKPHVIPAFLLSDKRMSYELWVNQPECSPVFLHEAPGCLGKFERVFLRRLVNLAWFVVRLYLAMGLLNWVTKQESKQ
jgi:hypothetical protein